MTHSEIFKDIFGLYATEVWSMPESEFLDWLNEESGYNDKKYQNTSLKTDRDGVSEKEIIYKQAAIDALERKKDKKAKGDMGGFYNKIIQNDIDALMQLPPAQPERKTGKWVLHGNDDDCGLTYWCSECNQQIPEDYFYSGYEHGKWIPNEMWNFCPNCGADMRGDKDE